MDYNQAVREKQIRQKEETLVPKFPFPTPHLIIDDYITHSFQQSFIIQNNFELRPFLWFHYKKKLPEVVIPTGLCEICGKLEVEHNA